MSSKRAAPSKAPAVAPKRQRKMLTVTQKVGLLDMLKEGRSYSAVGRHYGLNESTVRYIKKEENNIRRTAAISFNKDAKRVVTVRNKTIIRMESALALWISDCRKRNITLDTNIIRTKAKALYKTLAGSDDVHNGNEQGDVEPSPSTSALHSEPSPFYASKGWFDKFQKRFGLKSVSLQGEATPADAAGAEAYAKTKFKTIIKEGTYKPEQVFNMGETGLFWKQIPSQAKASGFRGQKDRVTLVMCGNAAGFMIKPGLISRLKNPRALKNKNMSALPVYWMHNTMAWMTKALNLNWFKGCFIPEVKGYLTEKGLDFKVLLLIDNAGGFADDLSHDGVQIEFLPPNTSSLIQPMDQGIIRTFKALYTRNTLQHLVDAMDSDQNFSFKDYWREYTIASCLQHIQRAHQEMKSETLNGCWEKLWPEAVHNPTESRLDEIHRSVVETAVSLAKRLRGDGFDEITSDDVNSLIDAHSQPLTDEDLAEMTKPPSEGEVEEDKKAPSVDVDKEDGLTIDHLATMVRMANELQRAAQEWDPCTFRSLQFSNVIEGSMSIYKHLLYKKKKKRQQLLLNKIFTHKNTSAAKPSVEKDATVKQIKEEEL
ncbi:tigger transposable element-derived protein 1-like [Oryzias latipes]|uniref:tigger transposable element-derived protein 1-like n=1 Tax=Oryzias latipes TaxID=8090 RepID=UPI0002A4A8E3|nr:tigger transposable element-derived protein 1-like [Oryzias latipes]XP_020569422.1 tigger transposable element-derived protein 1-like [Oryzias latipes]XP_020569423.1 tigger transposable element-derived protein 1-like [Oryzias latipes]XP_023807037.1 tigger transposable element-derived protein 1-like [Oryzias latipes]